MMYLRVIDTGANDGFYNMALDEAFFETLKGGGIPTLRFYQFLSPTITIGWLQPISDIGLCDLDIVRRLTGGRAVFHWGDLTYSLVIPVQHPILGGNTLEVYKKVGLAFSIGLKTIGIEAEFVKTRSTRPDTERVGKALRCKNPTCFGAVSWYELQVKGKKILGSAQRRDNGVILQQGTIPIDSNAGYGILGPTIGLSEIVGRNFSPGEIINALKRGLVAKGFNLHLEDFPTNYELKLAHKLIPKYHVSGIVKKTNHRYEPYGSYHREHIDKSKIKSQKSKLHIKM